MRLRLVAGVLLFLVPFLIGCSGGSGGSGSTNVTASSFSLTSATPSVLLGKTVQMSSSSTVDAWTVNGVAGGNSSVGTISGTGLYTAPAILPQPAGVTIGATSGSRSATASVTVQSDVAVSLPAPTGNAVLTASSVAVTPTITSAGAPNQGVTWTVGGVANGNSSVGTITVQGTSATYTAPATQSAAPIQIVATSVADPSKSATLSLNVQGIVLSAATGTPGQEITLTGHFDSTQTLNVAFTDGGAYTTTIPVTPSSATAATVVLPFYATGSSVGRAATVSVMASQGSTVIGSSAGFGLQALPAASGNPGDMTLLYLQSLSSGVDQAQHLWDALAASSQGKVKVTATDAATADKQTRYRALMNAVKGIGTTPYVLGKQGSTTLQLDSSSVSILDSILQAYVVNNAQVRAATATALAARGVSLEALSRLDQARAEFSLFGLSGKDYLLLGFTIAAIEVEAPAVAVLTAGLLIREFLVEGSRTTVAGEAAGSQSLLDQFNPLSTFEKQFQAVIAQDNIQYSTDTQALNADTQVEVTQLDDTNSASEYMQISGYEPTAPKPWLAVPPSNTVPSLSANSEGALSDGETVYKITFTGTQNTTYTLTDSWSAAATSIVTAADGYGSATLLVPAPPSGANCFSGSLNLAAGASTVASYTGCFSAVERHTIFIRPFDYLVYAGTPAQAVFTVNNVLVESMTITNGVPNPAFEICNVPVGKTFTLNYSTTNLHPGPDTGLWGLVTDNAILTDVYFHIPGGFGYNYLPSGSSVVTATACPTTGCATAPFQGAAVGNSCKVIPGVND